MKKHLEQTTTIRKVLNFLIVAFVILVLAGVFLGPSGGSELVDAKRSYTRQISQAIGITLFAYASNHNGHYPEGRTSTEVFQHLIDEKYVTDPNIFYVKMSGKVRPQGDHLKAENVGWDVTCCVDSSAPDGLPVVFLDGYKVTYQPGANALPLQVVPQPSPRTWYEWIQGMPVRKPYIAVCYKSNSARIIEADEDGSIPNFIPADFDPKGKTYQQLTP